MNVKTMMLLAALMLGPAASGQLKRVVCDETCRTEYQKTETKPAAAKPATGAKIRCDFLKSAKILELREKYYDLFRTTLRPSQIQKMYNIERQWAAQSVSKQ